MFEPLLHALPAAIAVKPLIGLAIGMIAGIIVGALPGLSVVTGCALLIPFTFGLDPVTAMALFAGMYNGGSYGGAITAILMRIPGTPGSVATVWDGYPLTQQGRASYALQISVISGTVGSVISAVSLILFTPPLSRFSLSFGPAETFWVAVFGLATVSSLLGANVFKGVATAGLGLLIGTIGLDDLTGYERYAFDVPELIDAPSIIVVLTGLYAIPPVITLAGSTLKAGMSAAALRFTRQGAVLGEWRRFLPVWVRSSIIGIIIGILPGAGGAMTCIVAWNDARNRSKEPETFGKGNPEGLAASECGNGADNAASMIPAFTLGIPGSGVAAVILGGLLVHGLRPGPELFRTAPDVPYAFMIHMLITALALPLFGGLLAVRVFGQALRLPPALLAAPILILATVGAYSVHSSAFDVWMMLGFGLLGFVMDRYGWPTAPLVLGVIVGPMAEQNLRLALGINLGDPSILWRSWISIALIVVSAAAFVWPFLNRSRASMAKA
ncbi:MAG: tripartite tricarboxylate transporter permease [Methylobacteriaceae bacterium]|nr:tripartite tricarboxylate transporter permease [Methylobacteriaceae bacterium]